VSLDATRDVTRDATADVTRDVTGGVIRDATSVPGIPRRPGVPTSRATP
jgi:hypothetical protein